MNTPSRSRLAWETGIVLALSLGKSGVYALIALVAMLSAGSLKEQQATLNASRSDLPWLDLVYQLAGITFALVPVLLAGYLIAIFPGGPMTTLGLAVRHPARSLAEGAGLAALIGIPGLLLYLIGREFGLTAQIVASGLHQHWWTIPVLILAALQNSIVEEVLAVGYLMRRLSDLRWTVTATIGASALLRGSYHLYQGVGPALGNVVMGIIFAVFYHRTGRLWPLIIAHALIDIVAFAGYALLADTLDLP